MIDFFANISDTQETKGKKKLRIFKTRVTQLNVERPELTALRANMSMRMKVTLPSPVSHKIQEPSKPESHRTRRGESASLF